MAIRRRGQAPSPGWTAKLISDCPKCAADLFTPSLAALSAASAGHEQVWFPYTLSLVFIIVSNGAGVSSIRLHVVELNLAPANDLIQHIMHVT